MVIGPYVNWVVGSHGLENTMANAYCRFKVMDCVFKLFLAEAVLQLGSL